MSPTTKWQEFWEYFNKTSCSLPSQQDCLQETSYTARRSNGRKVNIEGVYTWRTTGTVWLDDGVSRHHLTPHFVLGYLRALRNAYRENGNDYFRKRLYDQIDYMMRQADIRGANQEAVLNAMVWENRYGVTHAFEQAGMAAVLASTANAYADHGLLPAARGTMRYAFQAIEPLFMPVGFGNGGTLSHVQDPCGAKRARLRKGYWFHSHGVTVDTKNEDKFSTILNKQLHVICDLLKMYISAHARPELIPKEYGSAEAALARLEDRAIGGLYQLAFSRGNNSAAPQRPPNIAQFMRRVTTKSPPFYFSYYRFDLSKRQFKDITFEKTCHYHTHTLQKMAEIKRVLDDNRELFTNTPSKQGWRLFEAVNRLFEGEGEARGKPGSTHAIWQFWLSHQKKRSLLGCGPSEDDASVDKYYGDLWPILRKREPKGPRATNLRRTTT
jgi:hypothetical protein